MGAASAILIVLITILCMWPFFETETALILILTDALQSPPWVPGQWQDVEWVSILTILSEWH